LKQEKSYKTLCLKQRKAEFYSEGRRWKFCHRSMSVVSYVSSVFK